MGLYLAGRGSYSFGYTDNDGNPQWGKIQPRQDATKMGLPDGVIKGLKELKHGKKPLFIETDDQPAAYHGFSGGPIDMKNFKKASEDVAAAYAPSEAEAQEDVDDENSAVGPHVIVKPAGPDAAKQTDEEVEVRPAYAPKVDEEDPDPNGEERATPRPGEWEPEIDPRQAYDRPLAPLGDKPRQSEWVEGAKRDGYHNMPDPDKLGEKAEEVKAAGKKAAKAAKEEAKEAAKDAKDEAKDDEKPKAKAKGKQSPKN